MQSTSLKFWLIIILAVCPYFSAAQRVLDNVKLNMLYTQGVYWVVEEELKISGQTIFSKIVPGDFASDMLAKQFHLEYWKDSNYVCMVNTGFNEIRYVYGPWMDSTCKGRFGYQPFTSPRKSLSVKNLKRMPDSTRVIAGLRCVLYQGTHEEFDPIRGIPVQMQGWYFVAEDWELPFTSVGDVQAPLKIEGLPGVVLGLRERAIDPKEKMDRSSVCLDMQPLIGFTRTVIPPWPRVAACPK